MKSILQTVRRDRNSITMQSDILGAHALGINNILRLSSDHQSLGDRPAAKNVYDVDPIQLIQIVKKMRIEGKFRGGADIQKPPKMFIGDAANPFADPFEFRVVRPAKKVSAGVDFIQTQCTYNLKKFEGWTKQAVDRGLHEKVAILAGVTPFKSVGTAN